MERGAFSCHKKGVKPQKKNDSGKRERPSKVTTLLNIHMNQII